MDLQSSTEIIETTAKNGVVPAAISKLKLFYRLYGEVEDNFISYIFIKT